MAKYWYVGNINKKYLHRVDRELSAKKYGGQVKAFIPSLSVVKKKTRGNSHAEQVPLLFDYGFFAIPRAIRIKIPNIFEVLAKDVTCITGWLEDKNNPRGVARVTEDKLTHINNHDSTSSVYNKAEVDNIFANEVIELRGYTYQGMLAKVITVDKIKEQVEVELLVSAQKNLSKRVVVDFCNVFGSIYNGGYDDSLTSLVSLEELAERKTNILDRVLRRNADEPDYDFPVDFKVKKTTQ